MLHVKLDGMGIDRKLSVQNLEGGLFALTNQAHADMTIYVPRKEGNLRSKSFVKGNRIVYAAPYAKAQFRGMRHTKNGKAIRFRKYSTPGTGRRWDLRAKANHMSAWREAFIKGGGF